MKLCLFIGFTIVLIGSVLPLCSTACLPNSVCQNARDHIIQLDSNVTLNEKIQRKGRAWYIHSTLEPTNKILAFKNFSALKQASVIVMIYKSTTEMTRQMLHGNLGNFELVIENVIGIVIYVPIRVTKTASFTLHYYSGCGILSNTQERISSINSNPKLYQSQPTCWFIKRNESKSRIYFSVRDVYLNNGQQLVIKDLHTSEVISSITNTDQTRFASEAEDYQSLLIDLICINKTCSRKNNSFLVSYYGMTIADINCIETLKTCNGKDYLPESNCSISCPAFDGMLKEEYTMEAFMPRPRAGEVEVDDDEKKEDEKKPRKRFRRRKCPLPAKFCKCPRKTNLLKFCQKGTSCFAHGRCTFACLFTKWTLCLKLKHIEPITLLR